MGLLSNLLNGKKQTIKEENETIEQKEDIIELNQQDNDESVSNYEMKVEKKSKTA